MNILKKKPYKTVECKPYRFDFYVDEKSISKGSVDGTYLRIQAIGDGGTWELIISGNTHPFGYLLAAANQGMTEQLRNYARLIWSMSMLDTTDQGFDDDAWRVVLKWQKRKMRQGARTAEAISPWEDQANDAIMREAIERGKPMSRQQRRKMERESRKEMRDILREDVTKSAGHNETE